MGAVILSPSPPTNPAMNAKLSLVLLCACAGVALAQQGYNYNQPPPAPTNLYEQPARPSRPPRPAQPPRPAPPPRPSNNYGPPASANNPVPDRVPAPGGMEGMPYDFDWGVQDEESGNQFSHVETSDGQTTQGEYRVLLPDGRTQVVTFFDNGGGFNAEVTYEK